MSTASRVSEIEIATRAVTIDVGEYGTIEFRFAFRMDGTGSARDADYSGDSFPFTWDTSILDDIEETAINETLADHARDLFWDEINDQLGEERVLAVEDFGTVEVIFGTGSSEELERLVRLILYSFPSIWADGRDEIEVSILSRTENERAQLDEYCELTGSADLPSEIIVHIAALIGLVLRWIDPYGWTLEYNDGASGRASGYSETSNSLQYTIQKPSFHELAEAQDELLRLFGEHFLEQDAKHFLPSGD